MKINKLKLMCNIKIIYLFLMFFLSKDIYSQDLEKANRLDSAGRKIGVWVNYNGEFPREVAFYVADKLHGPKVTLDDSGFILTADYYWLGQLKTDMIMDSLYPVTDLPFFYSAGFTGRRYWLNSMWVIKNGRLHGLQTNFSDDRVSKNGKVYYLNYNGLILYIWFVDHRGRILNVYNHGLLEHEVPIKSISIKKNRLSIEYFNLKEYPVQVPYLPSRSIGLNMRKLQNQIYYYSNDTIYITLEDSISRRDFLDQFDYRYARDPVQLSVMDVKIEKVLLPNEKVKYTLKIDKSPKKIRYCSVIYRRADIVVSKGVYRLEDW